MSSGPRETTILQMLEFSNIRAYLPEIDYDKTHKNDANTPHLEI